MATSNTKNHIKNILALSKNPIPKTASSQFIQVFTNSIDLNGYVCTHTKDVDNFDLHASDVYFEELIEIGIQDIKQIHCIYMYYEDEQARQAGANRFPVGSKEAGLFKFCLGRVLEGQLENAETAGVVNPSGPINRSALYNVTTSKKERLQEKQLNESHRYSPEPKRFAPTVEDEPFIQSVRSRFICPFCQIFFQEPCQLECGHQLCQSCLNSQNSCTICLKFISKDKAYLDRGLRDEQRHLLTTCLKCSWTGTLKDYQEHEIQNHQGYLTANEQITQRGLRQQIPSDLYPVRLGNNSNNHVQGAMSTLSNISTDRIYGIDINQNLLYQEHLMWKERLADAQVASFDGTFTWKITNFREKRMNSQLQRPNSIYSPPFYSSPAGYKMRLRLFLNGDNRARGTHMSLYLVIMRSDYDEILHWPFNFKVTFSVLNHLQPNDNQSRSFWSDTGSVSFQRPRADMNIPYGSSKWFSLHILEQNENHFVRDDTLSIKVVVDFLTKKPEMLPNDDGNELINDGEQDNATNDDISAMICPSNNSNNAQQSS